MTDQADKVGDLANNMMVNEDSPPDARAMSAAALRFAEQFEMRRVLAAFEQELLTVVREGQGQGVVRLDGAPGE